MAWSDFSMSLPASVRRTASTSASDSPILFPAWNAATLARMARVKSVWPASQRLKLSSSCPIRNASSSSLRSNSSFTGALYPRSTDSTGSSAISANSNVFLSSLSSSSDSAQRGLPDLAESTPRRTGMWNGSFLSWPGVPLQLCSRVILRVFEPASYSFFTFNLGVPAWVYQRSNWSRLTPLASDMAARKSSHVTADPSCRSKYRSIPFRNPCSPRSV
mmetsp:Transcript_58256/g.137109  ORF Transcript_58256/g.137109 Transcript_58256/m.137109 type:complete len:218 (-) Transcript_58256:1219-1872(-)